MTAPSIWLTFQKLSTSARFKEADRIAELSLHLHSLAEVEAALVTMGDRVLEPIDPLLRALWTAAAVAYSRCFNDKTMV